MRRCAVSRCPAHKKCSRCDTYRQRDRVSKLAAYHARRARTIELLGGHCVMCGTTEDLEIDHIDPTQKTLEVGECWSVSLQRYQDETEKCQLLCRGCHLSKTTEYRRARMERRVVYLEDAPF